MERPAPHCKVRDSPPAGQPPVVCSAIFRFCTALAAVFALTAVASVWAAGAFKPRPGSRPDFVSLHCRAAANAKPCAIALGYLAALDLDRAREACAMLERSTLENAGGMAGCKTTLLQARGIRIRYSVDDVVRSPLGMMIRFSTRTSSNAPVRQQMLVTPAARILAIVPEP